MEYICNSCGQKYPKWVGRCTACEEWETIVEDKQSADIDNRSRWLKDSTSALDLFDIEATTADSRWASTVSEFDQVIGGGFVAGSVGLLGGEPGVGKSTLIMQLLGRLLTIGKVCLYISGEESVQQLKSRAERLNINQKGLLVATQSELEKIISIIENHEPDFVVIDSIQTIYSTKLPQAAGSVIQIRECSALLTQYAKSKICAFMLVAHVTKEGSIAGPKTIEHMVDYVLYLEGTTNEDYRFLRALKNRFGKANELGFFKMTAKGLSEVNHPNRIFLENWKQSRAGSIMFPASEGSRVMFVEIQVLVSRNHSNYPSRTTLGIERNRLLILIAILEKQQKLNLQANDIYASIANGLRVSDPAIDMALIGAIYSSLKNIKLTAPLAMVGSASLDGSFTEARHTKEKLHVLQQTGIKNCLYAANKPINNLGPGYHCLQDVDQLVNYLTSPKNMQK